LPIELKYAQEFSFGSLNDIILFLKMRVKSFLTSGILYLAILALSLSACQPQVSSLSASLPEANVNNPLAESDANPPVDTPVPQPTRPIYSPGELVDYIAQTGDTLPALAVRFNTSVAEILQANPFIPQSATTMPPGMPMKIPIYYLPLWGTSYQILPDGLFVNGPAQIGFDTSQYVAEQPGWLKYYTGFVSGATRSGAQIVDLVALNFSVSPRLLLALLEYQAGALSQPQIDPSLGDYPLGNRSWDHKGLYLQLTWAANLLNHGLAGWRAGQLTSIERRDGLLERFDPWLNAATVSLHNYFNRVFTGPEYDLAISSNGLAQTYLTLFGDPWQADQPHLPGSLAQPDLILPFEPGSIWAFTGGPHTAWGNAAPYAALDFAPPSVAGGCMPTSEWATTVADGIVVRSETGIVVLDLDGDGDERTGWNIFYLHLGTEGRATVGSLLKQGDPIGHPSCEGGTSTGTHVHIARKYNGEWMAADGILAFNLNGWIAHNGLRPYSGTLTRFSQTVTACECSNQTSFIQSDPR
jgi:murein DD-endopeptidase MepM/ murein hydrolase activator NlpD